MGCNGMQLVRDLANSMRNGVPTTTGAMACAAHAFPCPDVVRREDKVDRGTECGVNGPSVG